VEDKAIEFVNKGAPWRRDVPWPVIALEAVALIGIGAYILIDTTGASDVILQLIGLALLITSVLLGYGSFRNPTGSLGFYDAFRAGVGVTAGAIVVISWWSEYIDKAAQRNILGWGLIAYTGLHLIGLILVRGRGNIRISTIVVGLLTLILGIMLVTGDNESSESRLNTLAIILIVFGVALAALATYLFKKSSDAANA
jgi:uncharacterized membrane protein HdeD (DUF308 family)